MKRMISILAASVIFLIAGIKANADDVYRYLGDVDADDSVTVIDATVIQKSLASMITLSKLQRYLGDVDYDASVNVLDATLIQKKLANLIPGFYREKILSWKSTVYGIDSSNAEDIYTVDTEYQFMINAESRLIPDDFRVMIDSDVLFDQTQERTFSYTFHETGVHTLRVFCFGAFGSVSSCVKEVIVTDPSSQDCPEIQDFSMDLTTKKVAVNASGGAAPYRYCFTIRQVPPPPPSAYPAESDFVFRTAEDGTYFLYCGFCDGTNVFVPTYLLEKNLCYTLEVQALDSKGVLSEVKSILIQR